MEPSLFLRLAVIPAFELLGLDSPPARRLVVAIAWQESRIRERRQIRGPARGFLQFEQIGVTEVLTNPATRDRARRLCQLLSVEPSAPAVFDAIVHQDVLAVGFGRLLLWRDRRPLPTTQEAGWGYYTDNWRPGKPHPATWSEAWRVAEVANA